MSECGWWENAIQRNTVAAPLRANNLVSNTSVITHSNGDVELRGNYTVVNPPIYNVGVGGDWVSNIVSMNIIKRQTSTPRWTSGGVHPYAETIFMDKILPFIFNSPWAKSNVFPSGLALPPMNEAVCLEGGGCSISPASTRTARGIDVWAISVANHKTNIYNYFSQVSGDCRSGPVSLTVVVDKLRQHLSWLITDYFFNPSRWPTGFGDAENKAAAEAVKAVQPSNTNTGTTTGTSVGPNSNTASRRVSSSINRNQANPVPKPRPRTINSRNSVVPVSKIKRKR